MRRPRARLSRRRGRPRRRSLGSRTPSFSSPGTASIAPAAKTSRSSCPPYRGRRAAFPRRVRPRRCPCPDPPRVLCRSHFRRRRLRGTPRPRTDRRRFPAPRTPGPRGRVARRTRGRRSDHWSCHIRARSGRDGSRKARRRPLVRRLRPLHTRRRRTDFRSDHCRGRSSARADTSRRRTRRRSFRRGIRCRRRRSCPCTPRRCRSPGRTPSFPGTGIRRRDSFRRTCRVGRRIRGRRGCRRRPCRCSRCRRCRTSRGSA